MCLHGDFTVGVMKNVFSDDVSRSWRVRVDNC